MVSGFGSVKTPGGEGESYSWSLNREYSSSPTLTGEPLILTIPHSFHFAPTHSSFTLPYRAQLGLRSEVQPNPPLDPHPKKIPNSPEESKPYHPG
jgi:hypothetical protein